MVSLDLLRTFHTVYRAGTLTQAAQALGLSQPTVTAQIRALEQAVGHPLFVRQARGVTPTAAGDDLARQLDGPLDALVGVGAELGRSPELTGRTLHVGGPAELLASHVVPALAGTIAAGVAVRITLGLTDDLLADLVNARLDLVISTARPRRAGVVAEPLCDEEFVLVAAPSIAEHLDADLLAARPARALQALPLLGYAEELPIVRRWWRHVLGVPPSTRAALVAPDLRALRSAAVAGVGATVLPRYLCTAELAAGLLVELLVPADPPINTVYLATRTSARQEPQVAYAWAQLLRTARSW